MSTDPSSLMRALEAEAGTVMGVEADAGQLDMLRDAESGRLPSNVFRLARQQADANGKRGPGRPAGARNKRSDQLARLIVEKHGDPVLGMAALYAMPLDQLVELLLIADGSKDREERLLVLAERAQELVDTISANPHMLSAKRLDRLGELVDRVGDLAKVLKAKPGELALKALQTQLLARREVAQYVHGKMPVAVDLHTRADVILNIPGLTDPAALAEMVGQAELSEDDLARLEYAPFEEVEPDAA